MAKCLEFLHYLSSKKKIVLFCTRKRVLVPQTLQNYHSPHCRGPRSRNSSSDGSRSFRSMEPWNLIYKLGELQGQVRISKELLAISMHTGKHQCAAKADFGILRISVHQIPRNGMNVIFMWNEKGSNVTFGSGTQRTLRRLHKY